MVLKECNRGEGSTSLLAGWLAGSDECTSAVAASNRRRIEWSRQGALEGVVATSWQKSAELYGQFVYRIVFIFPARLSKERVCVPTPTDAVPHSSFSVPTCSAPVSLVQTFSWYTLWRLTPGSRPWTGLLFVQHLGEFFIDLPVQECSSLRAELHLEALLHQCFQALLRHVVQVDIGQAGQDRIRDDGVRRFAMTHALLEVDRAPWPRVCKRHRTLTPGPIQRRRST